ncbi:hypothetical protein AOLI_G00050860 [Acnodon oligacanthus]
MDCTMDPAVTAESRHTSTSNIQTELLHSQHEWLFAQLWVSIRSVASPWHREWRGTWEGCFVICQVVPPWGESGGGGEGESNRKCSALRLYLRCIPPSAVRVVSSTSCVLIGAPTSPSLKFKEGEEEKKKRRRRREGDAFALEIDSANIICLRLCVYPLQRSTEVSQKAKEKKAEEWLHSCQSCRLAAAPPYRTGCVFMPPLPLHSGDVISCRYWSLTERRREKKTIVGWSGGGGGKEEIGHICFPLGWPH